MSPKPPGRFLGNLPGRFLGSKAPGELPAEYTADSDDEDYLDDETGSGTVEKRPITPASLNNDNTSQTKEQDGNTEEKDDTTSRQGSTTEGAADTDVKDEEEKLELFELPEIPQLPSDDVEYSSLPDNQIKQMIDQLTSIVYQHTQKSLYPEDRLLFTALLCLSIQSEGDHFTEEEMALLLQGNPGLGMQLSLADFECKKETPTWLPANKWEDILAISVLPGPLDSLCVHMAEDSDAWKAWYRADKPEMETIPIGREGQTEKQPEDRSDQMMTPDLGPLTEFHLLLLLRLLRPDRLTIAVATYVSKNLSLNLEDQSQFGVNQLMDSVSNHHVGVLVLTPPSPNQTTTHAVSSINVTHSPIDHIHDLARGQGVSVEVVTVGNGLDLTITDALQSAERDNNWVVVENLHLATDKFFNELRGLIQRMARRRDPEKHNSKFCIWFTSEPCDSIPMDMLLILHKLSWDALETMATEKPADSQDEGEDSSPMKLENGSLENALVKAIVSAFKSVPQSTWEVTSSLSQNVKLSIYAIGITHGLLVARQMFGARGLSQFYSLDGSKYIQAIDNVIAIVSKAGEGDVRIDEICDMFSWGVYGQAVCNPWDKDYIATISYQVMSSITDCQSDTVQIGSVEIPVPPANVEPANYGSWFEDKTSGDLSTIGGLSLHGNVDREANDALAVRFMLIMDHLYEAQNLTLGDIQPVSPTHSMNMLRLRVILDNVIEALPPLLELGRVPQDLIKTEYTFPYHRPSIISLATAESVMMPESLGFVLLQECLWHNSLLCHIRQNVHEIHSCLLSGPQSFPQQLVETAKSIMEEYVPSSWVHPNCQPCTHSITSWLADLKKCHVQMQGWVRRRMVPVFKEGRQTPESQGSLRSVWLGGLVNPQALLVALQQEKSVLAGCQCDEVGLVVDVCELDSADTENNVGVHLTDLHIQGGAWDNDANCLTESSHDLNSLPGVYVRPDLLTNISQTTKYHCPVFMNKARQVCPFYLDLDYPDQMRPWILAGTAIILDIGVPEDAAKKSRSFLMPKAVMSSALSEHSSQRDDMSQQEEEEEYPYGKEDEYLTTRETERSDASVQSQSQLSYKPMSPQAPPLPPELQMTREPPMAADDDNNSQTKDKSQKSSEDHYGSRESLGKVSKGSLSNRSDLGKDKRYASRESLSKRSGKSGSDRYGSKESLTKRQGKGSDRGQDSDRGHDSVKGQGSDRGRVSIKSQHSGSGHGSDKGQGSARGPGSTKSQHSDRGQGSVKGQYSDRGQGSQKSQHSSEQSLPSKDNKFGSRESLGQKSTHSKQKERPETRESLSEKSNNANDQRGSRTSLNLADKPERPVSRDPEMESHKHSKEKLDSDHSNAGSRMSQRQQQDVEIKDEAEEKRADRPHSSGGASGHSDSSHRKNQSPTPDSEQDEIFGRNAGFL